MPLPLNHRTKRRSNGVVFLVGSASAAYAVPTELNIEIRGGRPSTTGAWERVKPFRKNLRESLTRLVISCDMVRTFRRRRIPLRHQGYNQIFEMKRRVPEVFERPPDQRLVGRCIVASRHVPKHLLYDALLALGRARQQFTSLPRARELRVGKS